MFSGKQACDYNVRLQTYQGILILRGNKIKTAMISLKKTIRKLQENSWKCQLDHENFNSMPIVEKKCKLNLQEENTTHCIIMSQYL